MHKPKSNKDAGQPNPNQQRGKNDECNVRGEIHIRGEIETNLPPSLVKERKTEREEDNARDNKNYRVALATLVAVIIYAFLTFWQGYMTREIINNTRKAERPYIWLTNNLSGPQFWHPPDTKTPDGYVTWGWHYTNYGKTPAYNVRLSGTMEIGDGAVNRERVLLPQRQAAPTPPSKDDFSTAVSNTKISPQEFQTFMDTDGSIVVFGRINYTDAYGMNYETGFCFLHLRAGATSWCQKQDENYIK